MQQLLVNDVKNVDITGKDDGCIIREIKKSIFHRQVIGKIASCYHCVNIKTLIIKLANKLKDMPEINAVGVVDDDNKIVGLIERRDIFDTLGGQFGRDLYKHELLDKVLRQVKDYKQHHNIFSVADNLHTELHSSTTRYFLITRDDRQFAGIFSTKDMLIYLSSITQNDIALARQIQSKIVHEEKEIKTPHLNILGASKMAKGVGGDFYFTYEYKKNSWIVAFCDVSGKGVSASLVSAILGGMFAVYDYSQGVEKIICEINEYMIKTFSYDKFLTGVFFTYEEGKSEVILYDMGHSHLYLIREDKFFSIKNTGSNLPLGVSEEVILTSKKIQLQSGEVFVLLTDGIIEQINESGEEFGEVRIASILRDSSKKSLKDSKDVLFERLLNYRGSQPQHDDMTIFMMERR